jgi:hypothetical protein
MTNIELETLTMAKAAFKKYIAEEINWEQRRYEIAKDVFCHHMLDSQVPTTESKVQIAVELADKLIEELKKKK